MEYNQKLRKTFLTINIIYEPVKSQNEKSIVFFPNKMHLAYRSTFSEGNRIKLAALESVIIIQFIMLKNQSLTNI